MARPFRPLRDKKKTPRRQRGFLRLTGSAVRLAYHQLRCGRAASQAIEEPQLRAVPKPGQIERGRNRKPCSWYPVNCGPQADPARRIPFSLSPRLGGGEIDFAT